MYAWQFQKALFTAEKNGWTKFVSMQNHYNMIYREEEREMMPLCRDAKIASTPYSPLASGRLCRDLSESTKRYETDQIAKHKYDSTADADKLIIDRLAEIAEKRGLPRTQIALAWLLHKPPVVAPVIGVTKMSHLDDAVASVSVKLSEDEIKYLEEPYIPHKVVGAI
jgi:aryl-alcohol dehydrogenase-like predicted oxidoreductase